MSWLGQVSRSLERWADRAGGSELPDNGPGSLMPIGLPDCLRLVEKSARQTIDADTVDRLNNGLDHVKQLNELSLATSKLKHGLLNSNAEALACPGNPAQAALPLAGLGVDVVGDDALDRHATAHGW